MAASLTSVSQGAGTWNKAWSHFRVSDFLETQNITSPLRGSKSGLLLNYLYLDALEGTEKKIPLLLDFKLIFDLFAGFGRKRLEFLLTKKTILKL